MTGANLVIATLVLGFLLAAPASPASDGIERDASTAAPNGTSGSEALEHHSNRMPPASSTCWRVAS